MSFLNQPEKILTYGIYEKKDKNNKTIVQYLQTTTGRVLLNYTIQTTLNLNNLKYLD